MRLIDADALKKSLEKLWNVHDDIEFSNKDVWREIENAPTIEQGRKVKVIDTHGKIYKFGSCGACGAPVIEGDKYCSECGAKLDWRGDECYLW